MSTLQTALVSAKLSSVSTLTAIRHARENLQIIDRQIDSAYNKLDYGRIACLENKRNTIAEKI